MSDPLEVPLSDPTKVSLPPPNFEAREQHQHSLFGFASHEAGAHDQTMNEDRKDDAKILAQLFAGQSSIERAPFNLPVQPPE